MSNVYYYSDISEVIQKIKPFYEEMEKTIENLITAGQNLSGLQGASYDAEQLKFSTNYPAFQTETITCRENAIKALSVLEDEFLAVDNLDSAVISDEQLTVNSTNTDSFLDAIKNDYDDYNVVTASVSHILTLATLPSNNITYYKNQLSDFLTTLKADLVDADTAGTKAIGECFDEYKTLINHILNVFDINVQIELLKNITGLESYENPYVDKLMPGEGQYNWAALSEIMNKPLEDVNALEYLAMVEMIDSFSSSDPLDIDSYNKFLDLCYIKTIGPNPTIDGINLSPVVETLKDVYIEEHSQELTDYFNSTTDGYGDESSDEFNEAKRIIFNMSVLKNLVESCPQSDANAFKPSYLEGTEIHYYPSSINLQKTPGGNTYDYELSSDYIKNTHGKPIEIKEFRSSNSVNEIIDGEVADYVLSTQNDVSANLILNSIKTGLGVAPGEDVVEVLSIIGTTTSERDENIEIGEVVNMSELSGAFEALGLNAAITVNNNIVTIDYMTVDEDELAFRLWVYEQQGGQSIGTYTHWFFEEGGENSMKNCATAYDNSGNIGGWDSLTLEQQQEQMQDYMQEHNTNE